jgi:hypothetical protein
MSCFNGFSRVLPGLLRDITSMYIASVFMSVLVYSLHMKQKGRGLEHDISLE